MTRTQNSFLNYLTGMGSTITEVLLSFVTRSIFIRTLGEGYLGIEGYFSSILSMLSLTELGFGAAIVFKLYKPLEEGDQRRIQVLMKLYRQLYHIVGGVIVVFGLCLVPFLPQLIRDYDHLLELGLKPGFLFLLYVFNSASSYWFFAYKSALVRASQKTYLLTASGYIITLLGVLAQILALLLTKNFIVYVAVMIAQSLARNLLYAAICDRRFPYIREKIDDRVSMEELKEFFKDCSALLIYKLNNVVISGTDNLILTGFVGIFTTGLYANYVAIRANLERLLSIFVSSLKDSLGSLYSTGKREWSRLAFRVVNLISVWVFGVGAIGVAVLADDFITLWVGDRFVVRSFTAGSVTVATPVALWLGIEIYLDGHKTYLNYFREAMGLFRQVMIRPILGMLLNLVTCLWLVPRVGIAGCIISTNVAAIANLTLDPIIIHKHALQASSKGYFLRNVLYTLVVTAAWLLCRWLCACISLGGILGFLVHGCVCVLVPSALFGVLFCRTTEFRFLLKSIQGLLVKKNQLASEAEDKGDAHES